MTPIDWTTPRNILEQEAAKDNPEALFFLGKNYEQGVNGCVQDETKSSEYFQYESYDFFSVALTCLLCNVEPSKLLVF